MFFYVFKLVFLCKYLKVFETFTIFLENSASAHSDEPAGLKHKVLTDEKKSWILTILQPEMGPVHHWS